MANLPRFSSPTACRSRSRRTWAARRVPFLLAASVVFACGKEPAGGVPEIRIKRLTPANGYNYREVRIRLTGSGFEAVRKGKALLEMWQGSASRLGKGFSLERVKVLGDSKAEARVPTGIDPGRYRLVVRSGLTMRFTDHAFLVLASKFNTGPPRIVRVSPERIRSGVPARLTVTGANLFDTFAMHLVGPLPGPDSPYMKHRVARGRWPYLPDRPRPLLRVRVRNGARVSATVPPDLLPGLYAVRITTATHKGHPPDFDHLVRVEPKQPGMGEAPLNFIIYFGVMGAIFLVGMLLAWRHGYVGLSEPRRRRHLAWMLAGLLFYVVLLGLLQFVFSRWY